MPAGNGRGSRELCRTPMDSLASTHVKLLAADLLTLTVNPSSSSQPPILTRNRRPISRAETLGVVVSRDRTHKFLRFLVDDGTGCVPCILWLNHRHLPISSHRHDGPIGLDLAADAAEDQAAAARLGVLVRVRGRVSVFRGSVQITVGDLVVERDANAEVLHWLECLRLARLCYDVKIGS